jgi:AcrR family transcriptional regulator
MGVKERRDRERTEIRANMLGAVREIAAEDGWQNVSIRRIAERTEYSPTLLYQYFESKEALVHEIRRLGYDDLLARLQFVTKKSSDPKDQLRRMARANIDEAFDQPEVFKSMLGMDGTPCDPPAGATSHQDIGVLLSATMQAASEKPALPGARGESDAHAEAFFAAVQGVVTMYLNGLLPGGRRRALKTIDRVVDGLLAGWFPEAD